MGAGPFLLVYKQQHSNFLPLIRFICLQNNDFSVDTQKLLGVEVKNTSFLPLLSWKALQCTKSVNSNFLWATWNRVCCKSSGLLVTQAGPLINLIHLEPATHIHIPDFFTGETNVQIIVKAYIVAVFRKRPDCPHTWKMLVQRCAVFQSFLGRRNSLM